MASLPFARTIPRGNRHARCSKRRNYGGGRGRRYTGVQRRGRTPVERNLRRLRVHFKASFWRVHAHPSIPCFRKKKAAIIKVGEEVDARDSRPASCATHQARVPRLNRHVT
jgi:hypothetical protein